MTRKEIQSFYNQDNVDLDKIHAELLLNPENHS